MSEYRPWAPQVETEVETEGDTVKEADPEYTPWAPAQPPVPVDPPKEKRFETPPGLGEAPPKRKGDNAHETAAAMLLWTGGFVLLASILFMSGMSLAIDTERITSEGGYDPDIPEMETVRGYGWFGLLGSTLFIAPGAGLLYRQAWARPIGFVGGVVALLLGPVGLILGIIALVNLGRMEAA